MSIEKEIKMRLENDLDIQHIEIKDFTGRHLNHKTHEGGFHLEATIVSSDFIDMSLIERHRVVYDSMGNMMNNEIHALSMKTLTPDEWEGK